MEDKKIVELFLKRIEQAIVETQMKYGKLCKKIATNILFNNEDAEEVVNDTYLGVWNSIPPEKPVYLMPFVCRITKNIAMNKLDYNNAKKRNSCITTSLDELDDIVSGKSSVEEDYEAKEIAGYISDFLDKQTVQRKTIFLKRYWYFDSIFQISEEQGMSENTVKSELFRLRKKLKLYLEERGVEL